MCVCVCVCVLGALTPGFKYIEQLREQNERMKANVAAPESAPEDCASKRLLLLKGAGGD